MNTPNRFIIVTYSHPFYHLKFIDLDSENSVDWQHNSAEGEIDVDLRNEPGIGAPTTILQLASQLWAQGATFQKIARTFPDT
jgi:hypothetical protein